MATSLCAIGKTIESKSSEHLKSEIVVAKICVVEPKILDDKKCIRLV